MTVLNVVLHSDSNAIGSSRATERIASGRARSPLAAAQSSKINSLIFGTQKVSSTVFKKNSPGVESLITVCIPVSGLSYLAYGSSIILQFMSDRIDISSPPFFLMLFGYVFPARIRSVFGINARI